MSSFPRSNLTIWLLSLFTIPKKNNNTRSCPHPKKTILLGGLQRQIFVMGRSSFLASLANPPVTFAFNPKHENNIDALKQDTSTHFNNNHSNLVMHRCLFFWVCWNLWISNRKCWLQYCFLFNQNSKNVRPSLSQG